MSRDPPFGPRLPVSYCDDCGAELDGAFDANLTGHMPKEGDYSVCIECGNPMVFRADQTLRAMTQREWDALKAEERREFARLQAGVDAVHGRPHRKKNPSARKN
jgi:hypothetical protein